MTKMFQISEDDLASLERVLPEIMWRASDTCNDPLQNKRFDEAKAVLSNVRWGYGPPSNVERIEA